MIAPAEDEERVWAVFPSELIHFVRQYTSDIQMPYGRDMLVESWDYQVHPLFEVMEAQPVRLDRLGELADEYQVHYVILNRAKPTEGDPLSCGLEKIGEIGSYDVFRNGDVPVLKKPE